MSRKPNYFYKNIEDSSNQSKVYSEGTDYNPIEFLYEREHTMVAAGNNLSDTDKLDKSYAGYGARQHCGSPSCAIT